MAKVLLALIAVLAAWIGMAHLRNLTAAQRRQALLRAAGWGLAGTLILMALTGRLHWLAAVFGALVPLGKTLLSLGLQMLPLWRQQMQGPKRERQKGHEQSRAPASQSMTTQEAMDTLGLKGGGALTRTSVIEAHRRLMQKLHPDRGGNDYLAAKVNEAKEVLLQRVG